jgi:hypothetical protein
VFGALLFEFEFAAKVPDVGSKRPLHTKTGVYLLQQGHLCRLMIAMLLISVAR